MLSPFLLIQLFFFCYFCYVFFCFVYGEPKFCCLFLIKQEQERVDRSSKNKYFVYVRYFLFLQYFLFVFGYLVFKHGRVDMGIVASRDQQYSCSLIVIFLYLLCSQSPSWPFTLAIKGRLILMNETELCLIFIVFHFCFLFCFVLFLCFRLFHLIYSMRNNKQYVYFHVLESMFATLII